MIESVEYLTVFSSSMRLLLETKGNYSVTYTSSSDGERIYFVFEDGISPKMGRIKLLSINTSF